MISIILGLIITTYLYIGNYIIFIPLTFLYSNYFINTKYDNLIKYYNLKDNIIINKFNNNILNNNFSFYDFILNNKYNNTKIFMIIIKVDKIILYILNDFLLFILFYSKLIVKNIISQQFKTNIHYKTETSIKNKKKDLLNLVNKKYN